MVNNTRKNENQITNIFEDNNEHLKTIEKHQKNNQKYLKKDKEKTIRISKTIRKNGASRSFRFVWWHWRLVSSMPP